MKKILSILTTMVLATTPLTTIVACGGKNDTKKPLEDPIAEQEKIIQEFEEEIANAINEHIIKRAPFKSILDTTEPKNEFLNKETLEKLIPAENEKEYEIELEPTNLLNINEDFNKIMAIVELKTKIERVSRLEKYSIIFANFPNEREIFEKIIDLIELT